jgi:hypothetical protein
MMRSVAVPRASVVTAVKTCASFRVKTLRRDFATRLRFLSRTVLRVLRVLRCRRAAERAIPRKIPDFACRSVERRERIRTMRAARRSPCDARCARRSPRGASYVAASASPSFARLNDG